MAGRVMTVTVASTSPLTVTFPGDAAGVTVPVVNTSGLAPAVGDRVTVEIRTRGLIPKVTGRVS